MNKELQDKWDEASRTGLPVDVGRLVCCDSCDEDYTDSTESGGFIFESKGICPKCGPRWRASAELYGEWTGRFVIAECKPGQSFADFVREHRGPNSTIHIGELEKL